MCTLKRFVKQATLNTSHNAAGDTTQSQFTKLGRRIENVLGI
jgi:hypothetical protein